MLVGTRLKKPLRPRIKFINSEIQGASLVVSPAPSISSLETFRGKPVEELTQEGSYLLFFWATWCGPCKGRIA
jgi:thiol-disulfide isomerase/thioredoxin